MPVQFSRPGEKFAEARRAVRDHHRQAARRPHRIAAADPVFKVENLLAAHAETHGAIGLTADRIKVALRVNTGGTQPGEPGLGVLQSLQCREALGDADQRRAFRLGVPQCLRQFGRIDVGDEVQCRCAAQWAERLGYKSRPEIGAADADAHHRIDRCTGRAEATSGP